MLYTAAPGEPERPLVDPMAADPTGATTLDYWHPSPDGGLLAYQLSEGGTEEAVLRIIETSTGALVDGPIDRTRYSNLGWLPDGKSFYYGRRLPPGAVPAGEEQFHRRVYLHRLGTDPDQDALILGDGLEKTNYYDVQVSRDGRWLLITAEAGTAPRTDVWVADLSAGPGDQAAAPDLRVLQQGVDASTWPRPGRDGRIYLFTDRDAPRGRIMAADPGHPAFPAYESWQTGARRGRRSRCSPASPSWTPACREPVLLAARTRHAIGEITVHSLATGQQAGALPLPGLGTVGGLTERPEGGHEAWFGYTDHAEPVRILHFDASTGQTRTWQRAPGQVDVPPITAEQVAYSSADGTTVRMLVLSSPAAGARTPRPAILYGYGGFNISLTPGLLGHHPGLDRGGRRLRDRGTARRQRGRRGVAPGRDAGQQAERLRRLPRGGREAHRRRLDQQRPARRLGRVQRRPAGGRVGDAAARSQRRGRVLGAAARHDQV